MSNLITIYFHKNNTLQITEANAQRINIDSVDYYCQEDLHMVPLMTILAFHPGYFFVTASFFHFWWGFLLTFSTDVFFVILMQTYIEATIV